MIVADFRISPLTFSPDLGLGEVHLGPFLLFSSDGRVHHVMHSGRFAFFDRT